ANPGQANVDTNGLHHTSIRFCGSADTMRRSYRPHAVLSARLTGSRRFMNTGSVLSRPPRRVSRRPRTQCVVPTCERPAGSRNRARAHPGARAAGRAAALSVAVFAQGIRSGPNSRDVARPQVVRHGRFSYDGPRISARLRTVRCGFPCERLAVAWTRLIALL